MDSREVNEKCSRKLAFSEQITNLDEQPTKRIKTKEANSRAPSTEISASEISQAGKDSITADGIKVEQVVSSTGNEGVSQAGKDFEENSTTAGRISEDNTNIIASISSEEGTGTEVTENRTITTKIPEIPKEKIDEKESSVEESEVQTNSTTMREQQSAEESTAMIESEDKTKAAEREEAIVEAQESNMLAGESRVLTSPKAVNEHAEQMQNLADSKCVGDVEGSDEPAHLSVVDIPKEKLEANLEGEDLAKVSQTNDQLDIENQAAVKQPCIAQDKPDNDDLIQQIQDLESQVKKQHNLLSKKEKEIKHLKSEVVVSNAAQELRHSLASITTSDQSSTKELLACLVKQVASMNAILLCELKKQHGNSKAKQHSLSLLKE